MCDKTALHYFPEGETRRVTLAQLDALQATVTDYVVEEDKGKKGILLKQHGRIIQEIKEQRV